MPSSAAEDEYGEDLGREVLGTPRAEPGQHLALRHGQPGERRDQLGQPRAGRDDEPLGRVGGTVGAHPHPVAGRLPIHDLLVRVDRRAVRPGQGQVRGDAAFRIQEAAVRLQDAGIPLRQSVGGEALADLLAGENLVWQVVDPAGGERAVKYRAARHADFQRTGDVEHVLARVVLQFAPERIRVA